MIGAEPTALASEAIGVCQIIQDVLTSETPFQLLDHYRTPLEDFFR